MHATNLPFLISVAKPINLLLCSELSDKTSKFLLSTTLSHADILKQQKFVVNKAMADFNSGLVALFTAKYI